MHYAAPGGVSGDACHCHLTPHEVDTLGWVLREDEACVVRRREEEACRRGDVTDYRVKQGTYGVVD